MNSLHEHLCPGLKGNNPLHFLASLGTFRLLCLHDPEARMKWDLESTPFPVYQTTLAEKNFCELLAEDFGWHEKEKETKRLELIEELFPATVHKENIGGNENTEIKRFPQEFRKLATKILPLFFEGIGVLSIQQEILISLANENILKTSGKHKGKVEETPLCFSNGSSKQYLLGHFRRKIARHVSPEKIRKHLIKDCLELIDEMRLNWDPEDFRDHALSWQKPESAPKKTNVIANAFAFIGLSFYPAILQKNNMEIPCYSRKKNTFFIPLWESFCTLDVIRGLLHQNLPDQLQKTHVIYKCEKITTKNGRSYFSPSTLVTTEEG